MLFELVRGEYGGSKLLELAAMPRQVDTTSHQPHRLSYKVGRLTSNRRQNSKRAC